MLGPITIIPRPRTTAETVAEIRTHIAAIDALAGGISWNSNEAAHIAEDVATHLTNTQDAIESALRYEDEYNDELDNQRNYPWKDWVKYP